MRTLRTVETVEAFETSVEFNIIHYTQMAWSNRWDGQLDRMVQTKRSDSGAPVTVAAIARRRGQDGTVYTIRPLQLPAPFHFTTLELFNRGMLFTTAEPHCTRVNEGVTHMHHAQHAVSSLLPRGAGHQRPITNMARLGLTWLGLSLAPGAICPETLNTGDQSRARPPDPAKVRPRPRRHAAPATGNSATQPGRQLLAPLSSGRWQLLYACKFSKLKRL